MSKDISESRENVVEKINKLMEDGINESVDSILKGFDKNSAQIERCKNQALAEIEKKRQQTLKEIAQNRQLVFADEYSAMKWIDAVKGLISHGVTDDILYDCFDHDIVDYAKQ